MFTSPGPRWVRLIGQWSSVYDVELVAPTLTLTLRPNPNPNPNPG